MGEADGADTGRFNPNAFEADFNLFCAEPSIDEQAGIFGGDIYGVSGASASEYTEFNLHSLRLSFKTSSIDKLALGWNIIVRLPA